MPRIGLIHPGSLVGKELRSRLEERPDLATELVLLAADEEEVGTVTEMGGAAAFVQRLDPEELGEFDLLILTGDRARDQPVWQLLPAQRTALLLSRGTLPEDATLAMPGSFDSGSQSSRRWRCPDPGTVALVTLLKNLAPLAWRAGFASLLLPASWVADSALDHLFHEARALLTFSSQPKTRSGSDQLAFNLIPAFEAGQKIEVELRSLVGTTRPITVAAAYAGVFHGLAGFLHLELERSTAASEVETLLAPSAGLDFAGDRHQRPNPVAAAREESLQVGPLHLDPTGMRLSLWFAMDNLVRGQVEVAMDLVELLLRGAHSAGA